MAKLLTVRVKKSRWQRGGFQSGLRMGDGKQCCIGFLARTLGANVADIANTSTLDEVNQLACKDFRLQYDCELAVAYETNDDVDITDTVRIKKLRVIGHKMGIKFVFVP